MPIPVHEGYYLAQVVMRPDTAPESNTFVNTFFFNKQTFTDPIDVAADEIEALMEPFYNDVHAPGSVTIASGLSAVIDPTLTTLRVYDLGEAAPRTPEIRGMGSWSVGSTALPNECAIVLSYRSGVGSVTGGTNDPTRRGRVYLGPFSEDISSLISGDQDAVVASGMLLAIEGAAEFLLAGTAELSWQQYSRKEDRFATVTGGFVDNRFDTQRRRGASASARSVWGA